MENEAMSKNIQDCVNEIEKELEDLENFDWGDYAKVDPGALDRMIETKAERHLENIEKMASDALGTPVMFNGKIFVRRTYKKASVETVRDAIKQIKLLGYCFEQR